MKTKTKSKAKPVPKKTPEISERSKRNFLFTDIIVKNGDIVVDADQDTIGDMYNKLIDSPTAYVHISEKIFAQCSYPSPIACGAIFNSISCLHVLEISPSPVNTSEEDFLKRNSLVLGATWHDTNWRDPNSGKPASSYTCYDHLPSVKKPRYAHFIERISSKSSWLAVPLSFCRLLEAAGAEVQFLSSKKNIKLDHFDRTVLKKTEYLKTEEKSQIYNKDNETIHMVLLIIKEYTEKEKTKFMKLQPGARYPFHELPKDRFFENFAK